MEKQCATCGTFKPETIKFFLMTPRQRFMKSCRECNRSKKREDSKKWRQVHPVETRRHQERWKKKNPEKVKLSYVQWNEKRRGSQRAIYPPEKQKIAQKRWRAKNFTRYWLVKNTSKKVSRAIESGKMIRPSTCSQCNYSCKPQAHHYLGYAPEHVLDVIFLCRKCHSEEHKAMKQAA